MKKTVVLNVVLVLLVTGLSRAGVRKGPYLIYPGSNTEMMVLWQLDISRSCGLEWGLDTSYADGNVVTAEYGADHQHKHIITGLEPGSRYYYRVTVDAEQYTGSFRAAPPAGTRKVKFLAYGDTRTNYLDHDMVNEAMVNTFQADANYQTMTLHTGDWVDDGEKEGNWTVEFFNPLCPNTLELQANLPINGCIGNHEWESGDNPPTYFDKYWPYPHVDGFYWSFDYGPVHITVIDQYSADYAPDSEQYNWLVNDLASTDKEWKLLQFHEPGYSAAGGHNDNTTVQNHIQPLCEQYGVDICFCGHNHYYARCDKNGVKHITSGGGGAPLRTPNANYSPYVEVVAESYHFCKIDIRGNELTVEAVTPQGQVLDRFTLEHPKVELVGPQDGSTVDAGGAALSCEPIEGAANYQLLFGPDPEHLSYLISETLAPPNDVITTFPFEQAWWTVRVRTQSGRNLYADPVSLTAEKVTPAIIKNLNTGQSYRSIQCAIDDAADGAEIVVGPGFWQYLENLNFKEKNVTVSSTDPQDPAVVAGTVINAGGRGRVVTFSTGQADNVVLDGFTITNGTCGIRCDSGISTIKNCAIVGNSGIGIQSLDSDPRIFNCTIAENKETGVDFWSRYMNNMAELVNCSIIQNGAVGFYCERGYVFITNCRIFNNEADGIYCMTRLSVTNSAVAGNGLNGILSGRAAITNCTVVGNGLCGIEDFCPRITNSIIRQNAAAQISGTMATYSNIEGGSGGTGNIDADPCFVETGYWDANNVWVHGDYHLEPNSPCIDAGDNASVPTDMFDLDGDGNTAEPVPSDLGSNRRFFDGDADGNSIVDMGAYEFFVPPIEVRMKFTPQSLNPGSQGKWVKAHLVLPEEFVVEDVDTNVPMELEPFSIESQYFNIFVNSDGLVEIEAGFDRGKFCACGVDEVVVTTTVTGVFTNGRSFCGTNTIKVLDKTLEQLAILASYWLEAGCAQPDWCRGLDADQGGTVNFGDFALLEGCCIEIVGE